MIRHLKIKDKITFLDYCTKEDPYEDFYITKDNKRLFLKDTKVASMIFRNVLKKCDKCLIDEEQGIIRGILLIVGYSDNAHRKYVKVLADSINIMHRLFKVLVWDSKDEIFIKVKRDHNIIRVAKKYKFIFCGGRGREVLLKREAKKYYKKEVK